MKKLLVTGLFAASLVLAVNTSLLANGTPAPEPAAEGVEISGAVDIVGGWQHDDKDATGTGGSIGGLADYDGVGNVGNLSNGDHVRMVVNQVEVDLQKSFGENIRLRADLDFRDLTNTGLGGNVINVEQAYVTANIAAGNGIEFLFGKFNAPVGVESVDSRDNWLISYAPPFRYMTPTSVTGAKLYYAFSDLVDLHFAVVNDLNNVAYVNTSFPSALMRLGFNWGEEGSESTFGISGGIGPEKVASNKKHLDWYGDIDLMIAASDTISLAIEGVYRQSNALAAGGTNQKAFAALAALNYKASDVWDITGRLGWLMDMDPITAAGDGVGASATDTTFNGGFEGSLYSGTLGVGYMVADDAKMKLEYRYDWVMADGAQSNSDAQSVLAQFAYSF